MTDEVELPQPGTRVKRGFWCRLAVIRKAAAVAGTRTNLQTMYPAAYKNALRYGWLDEVFPRSTAGDPQTRLRGYWTETTVRAALAQHQWESTAQMRYSPEGKAVKAACVRLGLEHLLPPTLPRECQTRSERERPRAALTIPINCWPFEGAAVECEASCD